MDRDARIESAAHDLREAQEDYMADRGNEELGKIVGERARALDEALGRKPGDRR